MGVAFYPAQSVRVGGTEIPIVQSASATLEVPKRAVYKFGQYTPVANIITEAPNATFQFSYILSRSTNTANALGVAQLQSSLSDFTVGKTCVLGGAGSFTLTKAFLTSFSVEGSVGDVVTCSASFEGTEASFSPGTTTTPINGGTSSNVEIVSPDIITVNIAGGSFPCKSFNFSIDIPREKIFKFGTFTPHATIPNRAPTAKIEAEIILGDGGPSTVSTSTERFSSSVSCGGVTYSLSNAQISSYSAEASIDGPATAKITLEQELENLGSVSVGG